LFKRKTKKGVNQPGKEKLRRKKEEKFSRAKQRQRARTSTKNKLNDVTPILDI
jgi:hypothetical protein